MCRSTEELPTADIEEVLVTKRLQPKLVKNETDQKTVLKMKPKPLKNKETESKPRRQMNKISEYRNGFQTTLNSGVSSAKGSAQSEFDQMKSEALKSEKQKKVNAQYMTKSACKFQDVVRQEFTYINSLLDTLQIRGQGRPLT